MKRAALAVTLLVAATGSASAGTYVGLGIGTAAAISEDTERLDGDGRSGKALLGMRFGNISVEGAVGKFGTAITTVPGDPARFFGDQWQASISGKLSLPLGNNFEAFGRVGLHRSWISAEREEQDVSGDGYLIGAGIEYRLNLVVGQGSIFLDYQYNEADLEGDRLKFPGASSRMWTLGLTVGL